MSKQHLVALLSFLLPCFQIFAATGDENWNQRFSSSLNGTIGSIAVRNGEVYAVGNFSSADGSSASHIAKWNGTNWHIVFLESMDEISVVATNADALYIAGRRLVYIMPNGIDFPPVMRWNGTSASPLGPSNQLRTYGDGVTAMHGSSNELYIAGSFAINSTPSWVARWNGTNWQALSHINVLPTGGDFNALTKKGGDLFAAGKFERISGSPIVNNVARWNGTNWLALGSGLNDTAHALAVIGNDVYVGGDFTTAGGVSANRIARWNGTTWSALGSGLNGKVTTLTVIGTDLYVSGEFSTAGGISSPKLAKWNGATWSAVNVQVVGSILAAASQGTDLYFGGTIDSINNTNTGNIFSYSSTTGSSRTLKGGVSGGVVNVLRSVGHDVYAGGRFRNLAGTNCHSIARFDGLRWTGLGAGLSYSYGDAEVYDIITRSNEVVVAGRFDKAGDVAVTNVARWNGTNWLSAGSGLSGAYAKVYALAQRGNELYAGGNFSSPTFSSMRNIARLDGSNWAYLPNSPPGPVTALAVMGNDLYVGGQFFSWPSSGSSHLAKWNGTSWSSVGSQQLNGSVYSLAVVGTNLYVGGYFTMIGSSTFNRIARWNGTTWSPLGTGLNGAADSFLSLGNDLYVGGYFTTAGGLPANRIARWNGMSWSSLGSGISGPQYSFVTALAAKGNDLLAGGMFTVAGGLPSYNLAAWRRQSPSLLMSKEGASVSLSWPAGFIPYDLQTAAELNSGAWANVPHLPTLSNGNISVGTNLANPSGFFRLQQAP